MKELKEYFKDYKGPTTKDGLPNQRYKEGKEAIDKAI
jgi:hypothetical protein